MATKTVKKGSLNNRIYKGTNQLNHDLYLLKVSKALKNMSYTDSNPLWEEVDHQHWFHTVDSSGRIQTKSTTIAGHFHDIEVEFEDENSPPKVKCVSGPLIYVTKKIYGKQKKVTAPYMIGYEGESLDNHTHEVEYKGSEVVVLRKSNPNAAQYETNEAQKLAPIPGVIG